MAASICGRPSERGKCWAQIVRRAGQLYSDYSNCDRKAREGKLTCHFHAYLEHEAQDTKVRWEKREAKA